MNIEYLAHKNAISLSCYSYLKITSCFYYYYYSPYHHSYSHLYVAHTLKIRRLPGCRKGSSADGIIRLRQGS